jgi:hypothetical protein
MHQASRRALTIVEIAKVALILINATCRQTEQFGALLCKQQIGC